MRNKVLRFFVFAATVAASVSVAFADPPAVRVPAPVAAPKPAPLPPLPAGVTALMFAEFYKSPVGPYGLEPTEKLQSLNGKKVRIQGFMARREKAAPGRFVLAVSPIIIEDDEAGFADLPPAHVWVFLPYAKETIIPQTHRPLLLVGTLEVGDREEKEEGTVSHVRLMLEKPSSEKPSPATTKTSAPTPKPALTKKPVANKKP